MPSGLEQNAINKSHLLKRTAMAAQGLKDYLQRYVDKSEVDGGKAKSKKKKKRKGKGTAGSGGGNAGQGVIIVDDDAVWHRERNAEEDEDEPDEEGEGPTVIEDVEVKRMHRMEAMKTHRPYLSMANDGSGWVTVKNDEGSPEAAAGGEAAVRLGGDENSVPRSRQGKSPDLSKRKRHYSPDLSPPRRRNDSPDEAPGRSEPSEDFSSLGRAKIFTVGDLSPPRRRKDSPDLSPPRRRHDSPPDKSPRLPTKRRRMDSPDLSPPRRRKGSADVPLGRKVSSQDLERSRRSEFSPGGAKLESRDSSLRKRRALDRSPPRRRHDSPPRKRNESPDLSPPRRRKGSADSSPPRTSKFSTGDPQLTRRNFLDQHAPRGRHESPDDLPSASSRRPGAARNWNEAQDLSPPRRNRDSPDLPPARKGISKGSSPPRKQKSLMSSPNQNRTEESSPSRKKGSGRMADGTFAGLKSDRDVVSEAERKRAAEAKMLSELDPSLSGRGAETVFRDKRGRRLEGLEEMLRQQRGEAKPAEQPLEWGKGLAQKKVAEANVAELEAEKSKPFARYRDDPELDKSLKERLRWGDPMAHLVKKKTVEPVLEDLGAREEMKASGFIVPQDIPKHSWLKRGIPPPPNRYDIRPGRHWDGVDRSTGFEQGLFKQKNEKKARDLEAYLWSVSDM